MELSDEQLMLAVQKDKLDQLKILFDRYQNRIYNYFVKCTNDRDDSADLTQNVFMRVMKYRRSYNGKRFETWIFQIARNQVKDHYRKLRVHHDQFDTATAVPEEEEDPYYENERKLQQAMGQLTSEKRELLVLSKFQGLKYEQIAEMKETSVSAIKVQVHRAIKQLRTLYFEIDE